MATCGGITYRASTRADSARWHRLNQIVAADAGGTIRQSEEQFGRDLDYPLWNAATDSRLAFRSDRLVGSGYVLPPPPNGTIIRGSGGVHPAFRGRGIGSRLLQWALDRSGEMHATAHPDTPWQVHLSVTNERPADTALLTAHGLTVARHFAEMQRRSADPFPVAALPDGLRVAPYDPRFERALYDLHMTAFADHWSFQHRPFELWRIRFDEPGFRPDLTSLAVDGADVPAGYVIAQSGGEAEHVELAIVGTAREWRGRGVASALIAASLQAARDKGIGIVSLGVDRENPTGAVGVYERMGFRPVEQSSVYALTLAWSARSCR